MKKYVQSGIYQARYRLHNQLYPERFDNINLNKLLNDFIIFNKKYNNFDFDKKLIITYEELVLNYEDTIKKILSFFNKPIPKKIIPLMRSKYKRGTNSYTGDGERRLKSDNK